MKKLISLALILTIVYSFAFAAPLSESAALFEQAGFAMGDITPVSTDMVPGQKYIESAMLQHNGDIGKIRVAYELIDEKPTRVAAEFAFTPGKKSNRQELISRISAIINAEGNYETDAFYMGAIAFLSAVNSGNAQTSADILRQILAQHEINAYFPDSPMRSYVDSAQGDEGFDANADAKNPVLGGNKYFLKIDDEGFVLSLCNTEEKSTIELKNPKETAEPAVIVNKQYAWDKMNELLKTVLEKGFEQGADPKSIALPLELAEKGKVKLICTGTGVLLTQDNIYRAFRHSDSTNMPISKALKNIVLSFRTLDGYARTAGAEGLELIVYFEDGHKIYNKDNITDFADLLTAAFGTPILLGEDESVPATEENLEEAADNNLPTNINLNQDGEEETNKEETDKLEEKDSEPTIELSPEPSEEANNNIGKQIKIKKKLVNIRQEAGGKVIYKLKRGKTAEITGNPVVVKGFTWYPINYKGKDGWVRSDTIKILDYVDAVPYETKKTDDKNQSNENTGEYSSLGVGNKGEKVKKLQERLIELGYLKPEADGKYGGKTERAVRAAQKAFNMKETGKADEAFQTKLFSENAVRAIDASMSSKKPETMKLSVDKLKKAEKIMKSRYSKDLKGYATGVNLNKAENNFTLTANAVDNTTSNYEVSISFNDATGAVQVNPKFMIKMLNLYVQDIEKIELVHGKAITEVPRDQWTYEAGIVSLDVSLNPDVLNKFLDNRITKEIRLSNATDSYTISMDSKGGPFLISRYMRDVWKELGAQKVADAAEWQSKQQ